MLAEADDIDEADTVEPDGDASDDAFGIVPVVDGLEGDVVDDFEIFGFEAEAFLHGVHLMEGAEGVHHPQLDAFDIFIFRHLDCLAEGCVDGGGYGTGFRAEAHVAAAEGEAVVGADDGAGDQLDGVFYLFEKVADDGYLLEVFLAEVGAVGLCKVEEAAHYDGDAGEMAGAAGAFHHLLEGSEVVDGVDGFGVHLFDGRHEGDVGSGGRELFEVGIDGAGVFGKVFVVVELYGVDEDADDDEVVLLAGFGHKREVSVVERPHGGDEADGFICLFGFLNGCGEGSYGSERLHCMMGLIDTR